MGSGMRKLGVYLFLVCNIAKADTVQYIMNVYVYNYRANIVSFTIDYSAKKGVMMHGEVGYGSWIDEKIFRNHFDENIYLDWNIGGKHYQCLTTLKTDEIGNTDVILDCLS